jgi:hypothetical protein
VKVTDITGSRPLGTAFHSSHHHTERGPEHVCLPANCETSSDVSGTVLSGQQQSFYSSSSWTDDSLKMKALIFFVTSGSTQPRTQRHTAEDMIS